MLRWLTAIGEHIFWPDNLDLTGDEIPFRLIMGHRQATDAYLLGLVIGRDGCLITLDRSILHLLPAASPHRARVQILGLTDPS